MAVNWVRINETWDKQVFETPPTTCVWAGFAKPARFLRACRVILARPFVAGSGTLCLYQVSLLMSHRDRAGDPPGRREAAGDAGHRQGVPTPLRRLACPTGTAVSQGFRTAARKTSDVPQSYAMRSWPKALGNRLYGSLSTRFGIRRPQARCRRKLDQALLRAMAR